MRKGKWKYLKPDAHFYGYAVEDHREKVEELYDLEVDIAEKNNLAPQRKELGHEAADLVLARRKRGRPIDRDAVLLEVLDSRIRHLLDRRAPLRRETADFWTRVVRESAS